MPIGYLARKLGVHPEALRRLAHFLLLAVTLLTADVLAMTLAESLFLANAGADRMPLFYVLSAAISMPVAATFSQLVDRLPRLQLFRWLLVIAVAVVISLRALVTLETLPVYYAVYIGFSLVELLVDIQFWVLISDYFTSLDMKRQATFVVAAMSAGGLIGGSAANLLSEHFAPVALMWILPPLYLVAIGQLFVLGRGQKPLESGDAAEDEESGLMESLKSFLPMVRRYPVIALIALGALVSVVLRCVAEFQVFSIYEETYPDEQELTGFLGLVGAALSVLEFGVLFFATRPLLRKLGVSRMNLIHPATTLASFAGLASSFQLPVGVAANFNYETLGNTIAAPTDTLNYNAVPRRFLGRVRGITDGLFYPGGTALAGGLLWLAQRSFSSQQITWAGLGLSGVFVVVGYLLGKGYLASLVEMLRSRSVNLDEVGEGLARLPAKYADDVRKLLRADDRNAQILGVELAARLNPAEFLPELEALLPSADVNVRRALVKLYVAFRPQDLAAQLRSMLEHENATVREMALEALDAVPGLRSGLEPATLLGLLADPELVVRGLACVAAELSGPSNEEVKQACERVLASDLPPGAHLAMIQGVRSANDARLIPLLLRVLDRADGTVKDDALEALAGFARAGEDVHGLDAAARAHLTHGEAPVRAAAVKLLGKLRNPGSMEAIAAALEDANLTVRENAASALAVYGDAALPLAQRYLGSARPEVLDAAVSTVGNLRSAAAAEALFEFMRVRFEQIRRNQEWLPQLPADPAWAPLRTTLEDSNQRIIRRALQVLAALGHSRTLNCVRRILYSTDQRVRADAVETLASLSHRRFVEPILPLLEGQVAARRSDSGAALPRGPDPEQLRWLLEQAVESTDRWVQVGALAVWASVSDVLPPKLIRNQRDPLVQNALVNTLMARAARQSSATGTKSGETCKPGTLAWDGSLYMNRVLFLRNVALFKFLSLDDLLIVDQALTQKDYLAGETIFTEGHLGSDLCVVTAGSIEIRKKVGRSERVLARLGPGECFGEMALFDDAPRSATAVAATDATLLTLERSRFLTLTAQRPEIAIEVCKVLSLRLREANERLGRIVEEAGLAEAGAAAPPA